MRTAYRGRAAAYEQKGDFAKALPDHNQVVTYYAIEVEILNGLEAPGRDALLAEAAEAYRARGKCLEELGRPAAAQLDRKRADDLQASAKELAGKATISNTTAAREATPGDAVPAGHFRVVNAWTGAVTVVIDGTAHRLEVGAQKTVAVPGGTAAVQVRAGPFLQSATFQAGRTYTIR